jgi:hypothetical protein
MMQSIFRPASRQMGLVGVARCWGDGGLKMDWTKPRDCRRPMGIESCVGLEGRAKSLTGKAAG